MVGFCWVDVAGVPPGKYHFQLVALVLKSVKFTQSPEQMVVLLAVKSAVG